MLSLRADVAIDGPETLVPSRGSLVYAATLIVAALLAVVRFVRFYSAKLQLTSLKDLEDEARPVLEPGPWVDDPEVDYVQSDEEQPDEKRDEDSESEVGAADVGCLGQTPDLGVRLAVYDFDETLTRATYPQAYEGTPFGCMALNIPWEDSRAGKRPGNGDQSPSKEFGGFDDARIAELQRHFSAMRKQGWTLAVLSYNLQWDKREFCLCELLDHYGLLQYFTHDGTPFVWGLRDMRRVGATSKGHFVVKAAQEPERVTGKRLRMAPGWMHLLVDDDEVNISGARASGLLGYQVAKRYEWDGLVGGLGRADPLDFERVEALGGMIAEHVGVKEERRPRRNRRRNRGTGRTTPK